MLDLSIIIPVYNAVPLLKRCLDSIFSQHTQYSYEVILVDDGSTDDSVGVIKARKEQNIVLYQQANAGPAAARNKGIELAKGKYAAYLDADDYWIDGFIQKTLDFMYAHTECVAVSVTQKLITFGADERINPIIVQEMKNKNAFILDDFYDFWSNNNHVCTGSVVMRKSAINEIGGQRADLRICEDIEFWPLIASCGKWGFIPEILFVSDGGEIVKQQGWSKYAKRFQDIQMFDSWYKRLDNRLTKQQKEILEPLFNEIIMGITRALISGGNFKRSYQNLSFVFPSDKNSYMVSIAKLGYIPWIGFSTIYRLYQYLKINQGVILSKFK